MAAVALLALCLAAWAAGLAGGFQYDDLPNIVLDPATAGGEVVLHVRHEPRARDDAGHRRMPEDPLQEELRPARAVELRRPRWQGLALHPREQPALREGAVDENAHAELGREREQAFLRFPLGRHPDEQLFYTRRVGAPPHGSGATQGPVFAEDLVTTVLGALKLRGSLAGHPVSGFAAVTGREQTRYLSDPTSDEVRTAMIEPRAAYSMAQIGRDLRAGRTSWRVAATSVVRGEAEEGEALIGSERRRRCGG